MGAVERCPPPHANAVWQPRGQTKAEPCSAPASGAGAGRAAGSSRAGNKVSGRGPNSGRGGCAAEEGEVEASTLGVDDPQAAPCFVRPCSRLPGLPGGARPASWSFSAAVAEEGTPGGAKGPSAACCSLRCQEGDGLWRLPAKRGTSAQLSGALVVMEAGAWTVQTCLLKNAAAARSAPGAAPPSTPSLCEP